MAELLAIKWDDNRDKLILLDQTILPNKIEYIEYDTAEGVYDSIKDMIVRGAPAIGVTAAYGLYFAAKVAPEDKFENFFKYLKEKSAYLDSSRPTAVNLSWALKIMESKALENKDKDVKEIKSILREEAKRIHEEDIEICKTIGEIL